MLVITEPRALSLFGLDKTGCGCRRITLYLTLTLLSQLPRWRARFALITSSGRRTSLTTYDSRKSHGVSFCCCVPSLSFCLFPLFSLSSSLFFSLSLFISCVDRGVGEQSTLFSSWPVDCVVIVLLTEVLVNSQRYTTPDLMIVLLLCWQRCWWTVNTVQHLTWWLCCYCVDRGVGEQSTLYGTWPDELSLSTACLCGGYRLCWLVSQCSPEG